MIWAANGTNGFSPYLAIPFFIVWCALMGSFLISHAYVAPRALNQWANEQGFKLIQKTGVGPFRRLAVGASNAQILYSIIIIDGSGATRSGLAKIGAYWWPSLSTAGCPIEVYWDGAKADRGWREV